MARSALHAAIWANDELEVARLLTLPETDANEKDPRGFTPLCRAIPLGRLAIAERLLSYQTVDVVACDRRGRDALFWAAQYGTPEMVADLLKRGAKVTLASENGRTVLQQALQNRDAPRMVQTLLQNGDWETRNNVRPYQKNRAFQEAIERDFVNVVRVFLDDGEDVNRRLHRIEPTAHPWMVYNPATPLMLAVAQGNEKMARLLLAWGADTQWNGYCRSALSDALGSKNEALVDLLRQHGAVLRLSDAVAANDAALVRRLVDEGANVNETVGSTNTPLLTWACVFNYEAVARLLVASGADINQADTWGRTPLSTAAGQDNLSLVQFLIARGADPLAQDKSGRYFVALQAAVSNRKGETVARWLIDAYGLGPDNAATVLSAVPRPDLMRFLIARGADVNAASDYLKRSPLAWASLSGNREAVRILLDAGAAFSERDRGGNTALSLAAARGSIRTTRLLLETGKAEQWDLNRALQYAANGGHIMSVRLLLDAGADPRTVRLTLRKTYYGGESERRNHETVAGILEGLGVPVERPEGSV